MELPQIDPQVDWETLNQVEEGWDRRCRRNWPRFLRACAVALLARLPPEAGEWIAAADRYESGQSSRRELAEVRQRAGQFFIARKATASMEQLCALSVALYRLTPRKADWPTEEYDETCNFIECCLGAGMPNEVLNQLLREHCPSAFEPRPWWKFW